MPRAWAYHAVNIPCLRPSPLTAANHQPGHYQAVKSGFWHYYCLIITAMISLYGTCTMYTLVCTFMIISILRFIFVLFYWREQLSWRVAVKMSRWSRQITSRSWSTWDFATSPLGRLPTYTTFLKRLVRQGVVILYLGCESSLMTVFGKHVSWYLIVRRFKLNKWR